MSSRGRTQLRGQVGVNIVESIALNELGWRWQSLDQQNDDGLDGLLLVEDRKGELTGQIIFAQVKCWKKKLPKSGVINLSISGEKLKIRARRWRRLAGASIIIWVNPDSKEAFWADLQDANTYSEHGIRISTSNRFAIECSGRLRRLAGTQGNDNLLPILHAKSIDTSHISPTLALKKTARELYRTFGMVVSPNPRIEPVNFSRVGWRHITRRDRPVSRVVQSLQLLSIARRMVAEIPRVSLLRAIGGAGEPAEIYAIDARVVFRNRDAAVVRVILLRQIIGPRVSTPRTWFYSIYERRRRKGLRGEHIF